MPKKNGILKDFEDKKTKAGDRYTRFKIDQEWYSCFNKDEAKKLKDFEQKPCAVETKTAGNFTNIVKVLDDFTPEDSKEVEIVTPQQTPDKPTTDRVDRAKALEIAKGDIELANKYFNYITKGE